ncbi:unnamed protein product [Toxocara canis]|uniref:Uncharacterized protein n=1 Tax=Toxocara canis TaxID=6265 RepID=A0A183UUX1_TOXCA|nr:unnamed protein product [Toxocara canis]
MPPDLTAILLRLRQPPIASIRGLENVFLQEHIDDIDRDITRFLWLEDPTMTISPTN